MNPAFDCEARQAHIFEKPPRIPPLTPDEFSGEADAIITELRASISLPPAKPEDVPKYAMIVLRHPLLFKASTELGTLLFKGALSPRHRELAVLRVAWLCKSPYEWGEHVGMGKKLAGLTTAEIERVTSGSAASGWDEDDRAVIRAAEELYDDAMISDQTWAALARSQNEQQLIELPLLVGQYMALAFALNSLRCRMEPGNPGFAAR